MTSAGATSARPPIPAVIKRNTLLVAASQVCSGMGTGLLPSLGALMVYQMLGSTALAGAAAVIQGVTRFLVAYPIGSMADRYGRKPAIVVGLVAAIAGALIIGMAVSAGSFPLLIAGIAVFAAASNGTQQLRVAATDMYPPTRRAEGLGYVLTGSVVGSIGQTGLITLAAAVAPALSVDPMALSWWLVPLVLLGALALVSQIRPDPLDIARDLASYYPGHDVSAHPSSRGKEPRMPGGFGSYLKDRRKLTVFISIFAVQGNMAMTMVVSALTLALHGHDLPAIGFSATLHALGMFAFSIPQGRLADRFGRKPVMLSGLLLAALGTVLVALTGDYWVITLGYFLVGFGWSAVYVAGTVLLADVSHPMERARVIGSNDTFAGAANTLLAMMSGPVLEVLGMPAIAATGILLMVIPFFMIVKLEQR